MKSIVVQAELAFKAITKRLASDAPVSSWQDQRQCVVPCSVQGPEHGGRELTRVMAPWSLALATARADA